MEKEYDLGIPLCDGKKPFVPARHLDLDKLLRLHPNWFIETLETSGDTFTASLKDYVTDKTFSLAGRLETSSPDTVILEMTSGVVRRLHIRIGPKGLQALVIYQSTEPSKEEEETVLLWIRSIGQYLRLYISTTPNTLFFRLVMNRMLLKMNPSQRKISIMLIRITIVEMAVIVIILLGYFFVGR